MRLRTKHGKKSIGLYLEYKRRYCSSRLLQPLIYYDIDEFIDIHLNVNKYKNYCEVLINDKGQVAYAIPSHTEAVYNGNVVTKAKYEYNTSPADYSMEHQCDTFNVMMVWYELVVFGRKQPTPEQVFSLYKLYASGCVNFNCWNSFNERLKYFRYIKERYVV